MGIYKRRRGCVWILFTPYIVALTVGIVVIGGYVSEEMKAAKINEICVEKFNTPEEIKQCKAVLTEMPKDSGGQE